MFPITNIQTSSVNIANQQTMAEVGLDQLVNKEVTKDDMSDYGAHISDTASTLSVNNVGVGESIGIIFEPNEDEDMSFEGKQLNDESFMRNITLNIDKGVLTNLQNQLQNNLHNYSLARPIASDE